jgi:hypothetical protein
MADINDVLNLYLSGVDSCNDSMSLYIQVSPGSSEDIPLYIATHCALNSFMSLYMQGIVPINESMSLYVDGIGIHNNSCLLYIHGHVNAVNTYATLFLQTGTAGTFGVQSSIPLYMGPPSYEQEMPLFLMNTQTSAPFSGVHTLFMNGRMNRLSGHLDLLIFNEQIAESLTLYVKAPGFWSGFVPYGQAMPMYLQQDGVDIHSTLFVGGKSELNTFISLYTLSTVDINESLTLVIPHTTFPANTFASCYINGMISDDNSSILYTLSVGDTSDILTLVMNPNIGSVNTYANLYIKGMYLDTEQLDLYINGIYDASDSIPLYMQQNNALLNTYASLYISGAYVESTNCTLTIPDTIDYDSGVTALYVFGW